jgi:transposase-like protein
MGEFPRKSDGRRAFTMEFKRGAVQQLLKGDKTLAQVLRELDIQPSVVRQWRRRFEAGATAAVATNEDVVPVSALREAHQRTYATRVRPVGFYRRCDDENGAPADPNRYQQSRHVRLPAGVGNGQPDLSPGV